jgi:hypothetical protein
MMQLLLRECHSHHAHFLVEGEIVFRGVTYRPYQSCLVENRSYAAGPYFAFTESESSSLLAPRPGERGQGEGRRGGSGRERKMIARRKERCRMFPSAAHTGVGGDEALTKEQAKGECSPILRVCV